MKSKETKRQEAALRDAAWAALTPQEQLAHLDKLGVTATKQRARLAKLINVQT